MITSALATVAVVLAIASMGGAIWSFVLARQSAKLWAEWRVLQERLEASHARIEELRRGR